MATRVMCLGKYKEFATTNANKRQLVGYFIGAVLVVFSVAFIADLAPDLNRQFWWDETRFTLSVAPRMSPSNGPTTSVI